MSIFSAFVLLVHMMKPCSIGRFLIDPFLKLYLILKSVLKTSFYILS